MNGHGGKMWWRQIGAMVILVALSLGVGFQSVQAASTRRQIRVATISPRLSGLPQLLAGELLKQRGIAVDWKFFQSDGAITQALAAGAVDFAITNATRIAQLNEQGGRVRAITVALANDDWVFVARKNIASVEALTQKTVGISSPGSATDVLFRKMLSKRAVSPESAQISLVAIGGAGARVGAMRAGRIDAAWLGYDGAFDLIKSGDFHVLEGISAAKEFPDKVATMWVARLSYIEANRSIAYEVVRAQILGHRLANIREEFLRKARNSSVEEIRSLSQEALEWASAMMVEDKLFPLNGGLSAKALAIALTIPLESGDIKRMPPFSEVAVTSIQSEVLEELGRK